MRRIINTILLIAAVTLTTTELYGQREVHNINRGWSYSAGWELTERADNREAINIPHTWNLDALAGEADYHRGLGNYLYKLSIDPSWAGKKHVYIRFGGVNQSAEVYVNGHRVGSHKGGYTAFGFDVTSYLNFSGTNTLWVRVSNARNLDIMPLIGGFNMYGGIYRDVEMIVTPNVHISHTDYATNGVKVTPMTVNHNKASVNISTAIEGPSGSYVDLRMKLLDGSGVAIDSMQKSIKIGIKGEIEPHWAVTIQSPRLWNGTIDPHQYRVEVLALSAQSGTATKDSTSQQFGLRYYSVNSDNKFMLNGKEYPVRGVNRVEDIAMLGSAMYDEQHHRDLEIIKEMGANAVRLSYFPQNSYFMELCDRAGILVWSEIPFVGPGKFRDSGYNSSEEFQENGQRQLQELIAQNFNSPSFIFLGLFSEIDQRGDDPLNYIKLLNTIAKDEAPALLTVGASNQDGQINFATDLIGFNQYLGWNSGLASDIAQWAKSVRGEWPRLKVAISEYGAGASIYQHEDNPVKPVVESYWHPEEYQTYLHEQYYRSIAGKGYFWGTFISSMFDWGAAHLRQGGRAGISDLGLVTFDRGTKKDAYYFYKANWNKEDSFVYITSRRHTKRQNNIQNIKVFSPSDSVTLSINGTELETKGNDGFGTFTFNSCTLERGVNTIKAETLDGKVDEVEITIERVTN